MTEGCLEILHACAAYNHYRRPGVVREIADDGAINGDPLRCDAPPEEVHANSAL
jgi:hypothetical protein